MASVTTATSAVPLTTIFTPPASCLPQSWTYFPGCDGSSGIDCTPGLSSTAACFPSGSNLSSLIYPGGLPFSPGVCPSGYTLGVQQTLGTGSASSTVAYCCPSGAVWKADYELYGWCSALPTRNAIITGSLDSTEDALNSTATVTDAILTVTSGSGARLWTFTGYAFPIVVTWASTDLYRFTPASAPLLAGLSTAAPSPTSKIAQTTSTEPVRNTATAAGKNRLSTGAQAGIGVGVSIAGLCVLIAGGWLLLRRRKNRSVSQDDKQPYVDAKAELPDKQPARTSATAAELAEDGGVNEMPASARQVELPATSKPLEMDSQMQRHELEAATAAHEVRATRSPVEASGSART